MLITAETVRDNPDLLRSFAAYISRGLVRQRLAKFSVPRDVVFLAELPRNATGKVVPRLLPAP